MMKDSLESTTLYSFLGTHAPYWRLSEDSNTLHLSVTEATDRVESVELAPEQAERIREMTVITSGLMMTLPLKTTMSRCTWWAAKLTNMNGLAVRRPGTTPLLLRVTWSRGSRLLNK